MTFSSMMTSFLMKIVVLNGPNLNLLGQREPEIYGSTSLLDIENNLQEIVADSAVELDFFQSNKEYELVEKIQALMQQENHHQSCCFYAHIGCYPRCFTSHTNTFCRGAFVQYLCPRRFSQEELFFGHCDWHNFGSWSQRL